MKNLLAIAAALLVASPAFAQRIITHGATDQSVYIRIIDSGDGTPETGVTSATSGIDLEYVRNQATPTDITESDLAATNSTHSDGGIKHIGWGLYRVDLPDAAIASGAPSVVVGGTITGMIVVPVTVQLTAADFQTALADENDMAQAFYEYTSPEPTSPPAANASVGEKIAWLFLDKRNKKTVTENLITWFADDGTTAVGESAINPNSDTEVTTAEAAAP